MRIPPVLLTLLLVGYGLSRVVQAKPMGAEDKILGAVSKALGGSDKEKTEALSLVLELLAEIDLATLCQSITQENDGITRVDDFISRAASENDVATPTDSFPWRGGNTDVSEPQDDVKQDFPPGTADSQEAPSQPQLPRAAHKIQHKQQADQLYARTLGTAMGNSDRPHFKFRPLPQEYSDYDEQLMLLPGNSNYDFYDVNDNLIYDITAGAAAPPPYLREGRMEGQGGKDDTPLFFPEDLLSLASLTDAEKRILNDVIMEESESLKPELKLLAESLKLEGFTDDVSTPLPVVPRAGSVDGTSASPPVSTHMQLGGGTSTPVSVSTATGPVSMETSSEPAVTLYDKEMTSSASTEEIKDMTGARTTNTTWMSDDSAALSDSTIASHRDHRDATSTSVLTKENLPTSPVPTPLVSTPSPFTGEKTGRDADQDEDKEVKILDIKEVKGHFSEDRGTKLREELFYSLLGDLQASQNSDKQAGKESRSTTTLTTSSTEHRVNTSTATSSTTTLTTSPTEHRANTSTAASSTTILPTSTTGEHRANTSTAASSIATLTTSTTGEHRANTSTAASSSATAETPMVSLTPSTLTTTPTAETSGLATSDGPVVKETTPSSLATRDVAASSHPQTAAKINVPAEKTTSNTGETHTSQKETTGERHSQDTTAAVPGTATDSVALDTSKRTSVAGTTAGESETEVLSATTISNSSTSRGTANTSTTTEPATERINTSSSSDVSVTSSAKTVDTSIGRYEATTPTLTASSSLKENDTHNTSVPSELNTTDNTGSATQTQDKTPTRAEPVEMTETITTPLPDLATILSSAPHADGTSDRVSQTATQRDRGKVQQSTPATSLSEDGVPSTHSSAGEDSSTPELQWWRPLVPQGSATSLEQTKAIRSRSHKDTEKSEPDDHSAKSFEPFAWWAGREVKDRWSQAKDKVSSAAAAAAGPYSSNMARTLFEERRRQYNSYTVRGGDENGDGDHDDTAQPVHYGVDKSGDKAEYSTGVQHDGKPGPRKAWPAMRYRLTPKGWSRHSPHYVVPNLGTLWGMGPHSLLNSYRRTLRNHTPGDFSSSSGPQYLQPARAPPSGQGRASEKETGSGQGEVAYGSKVTGVAALARLGLKQKTIWSEAGASPDQLQSVRKGYACPGLFGYFGDFLDCRSFFICSWGVPYRFYCPSGTRWNPSESVCDWSRNVQCPSQ